MTLQTAMERLCAACSRLPDFGGDLWSRGIERLEAEYGVIIYLSRFEPDGMTEGEMPETTITIVGGL